MRPFNELFCSTSVQKKTQALGYMKNTMFRFSVHYITVNMKSNVARIRRGWHKGTLSWNWTDVYFYESRRMIYKDACDFEQWLVSMRSLSTVYRSRLMARRRSFGSETLCTLLGNRPRSAVSRHSPHILRKSIIGPKNRTAYLFQHQSPKWKR